MASNEARRKLGAAANDVENIGRTERRGIDFQLNLKLAHDADGRDRPAAGAVAAIRTLPLVAGERQLAQRLAPALAGRGGAPHYLHKFGGITGAAVLLVLALSSFALSLPGWANPLINWFSPVSAWPHVHSQQSGGNRIGFDAALGVASSRFPGAEPRWVESPADEAGSYLIRMYQAGEPGRRFPRTMVWVDQYSGAVLAQRDARRRTAGEGLLAWLHPLHSGEAFGLPGRIVVLLCGLILPLLYVSGVLRWRQKRRAQQQVLRQRR